MVALLVTGVSFAESTNDTDCVTAKISKSLQKALDQSKEIKNLGGEVRKEKDPVAWGSLLSELRMEFEKYIEQMDVAAGSVLLNSTPSTPRLYR